MRQLYPNILWCCSVSQQHVPQASRDKVVLVAGGGTAVTARPSHGWAKFVMPLRRGPTARAISSSWKSLGQRVRRIDSKGIISTVAVHGRERRRWGLERLAIRKREFNAPHSLAVTPNGDIIVADTN